MRARVTNRAAAARGFHTTDGGTAMLDPGASTVLDLASHPAHDAWAAVGEVSIEAVEPDLEARPDGGALFRPREHRDPIPASREGARVSRRSRDG